MTKLNPADLRDLLDRRATPHERRVVEGLAIADGVLWRCRMKSCAAINNDGWVRCFKCGADRKG